jgi:flagellar basal-body rod modification protein FlgD
MGSDYNEYLNDQRVRKTQLGKNDFLNLLAAQMQYQNPLEPMSDTAFIAQLAQFSSLEQMEAMSSSMLAMQSYNMVGKLVSASNVLCDDGLVRNIDGYVEYVVQRDGGYFAKVGEYFIPVSRITDVYDKQSISPDNPLVGAAHLIGCSVKAYEVEVVEGQEKILYGEDGQPRYSSGVVTGLAVLDNTVVAYLRAADGTEFSAALNHIFDIRQTATPQEAPAIVPPAEAPIEAPVEAPPLVVEEINEEEEPENTDPLESSGEAEETDGPE